MKKLQLHSTTWMNLKNTGKKKIIHRTLRKEVTVRKH